MGTTMSIYTHAIPETMIQAKEKLSRLLMDSNGLTLKKVVKPKTEEGVWIERRLYGVGERSLFHTLRSAPSVMGRAPANRKTISPIMRSHSSVW